MTRSGPAPQVHQEPSRDTVTVTRWWPIGMSTAFGSPHSAGMAGSMWTVPASTSGTMPSMAVSTATGAAAVQAWGEQLVG